MLMIKVNWKEDEYQQKQTKSWSWRSQAILIMKMIIVSKAVYFEFLWPQSMTWQRKSHVVSCPALQLSTKPAHLSQMLRNLREVWHSHTLKSKQAHLEMNVKIIIALEAKLKRLYFKFLWPQSITWNLEGAGQRGKDPRKITTCQWLCHETCPFQSNASEHKRSLAFRDECEEAMQYLKFLDHGA